MAYKVSVSRAVQSQTHCSALHVSVQEGHHQTLQIDMSMHPRLDHNCHEGAQMLKPTCKVVFFMHEYLHPYDSCQGVHALVCPAAAAPLCFPEIPKVCLCNHACLQDCFLQHTLYGGQVRQLPVGLQACRTIDGKMANMFFQVVGKGVVRKGKGAGSIVVVSGMQVAHSCYDAWFM